MENPITCIPCGHTFCKTCEEGYSSGDCLVCNREIDDQFKNDLVTVIVSKTKYRKELFLALDEN